MSERVVTREQVAATVGDALTTYGRSLQTDLDRRLCEQKVSTVLRAGETKAIMSLIARDRIRCERCEQCVPDSEFGRCGGCNLETGQMTAAEVAERWPLATPAKGVTS